MDVQSTHHPGNTSWQAGRHLFEGTYSHEKVPLRLQAKDADGFDQESRGGDLIRVTYPC